jgi:hypothetical protein
MERANLSGQLIRTFFETGMKGRDFLSARTHAESLRWGGD